MSQNKLDFFYLSTREESVMKVLWSTDKALSASEIADQIPNRTWPAASVQSILRGLEKKNAIHVDQITKLGKSYGRLFRPTISANEYATMQFRRYYQKDSSDYFSMLSSLLGNNVNDKDEILDALYTLIEEYKEE